MIIGVGESGKSGLARKLIAEAGLPFYVRDPIMSEWAGACLVTDDNDEFKRAVMSDERPRIAVWDEAMEGLGVGDKQNHIFFTRWRHHAILPIAIAQRYTMIAPNLRVNATDLYIFETGRKDCEMIADEYNCPEIIGAVDFIAGDFFHFQKKDDNGKKSLTRHRLW